VFGIFAGTYKWKVISIKEEAGTVHFITTFIGVNGTFMPMHFIGINGMSRRISDYADVYSDWNRLISMFSMISVISIIIFLNIVLQSMIKKRSQVQINSNEYFIKENKTKYCKSLEESMFWG
jgi:heme/copper-type cytochrome/quinol oxidase subunit 1